MTTARSWCKGPPRTRGDQGGDASRYGEDRALVERVVSGLRAGRADGVGELYRRYHGVLMAYACVRTRDPHLAGDVVGTLWVRVMERGVLERYAGRASLRSYLLTIVEYMVRDALRARGRQAPGDGVGGTGPWEAVGEPPDRLALGEERDRLVREIVGQTLLELSEEHPRCALIVWMRLAGLPYREIARIELAREQAGVEPSPRALQRRTLAVKKLTTRRNPPGCLARFRRIHQRVLEDRGLEPEDLFG